MKSILTDALAHPAFAAFTSGQRLQQFAAQAILPAALLCKERSEQACRKAGKGYDERNVTAEEIATQAMQIAVALEQEFAAKPDLAPAPKSARKRAK